MKNKRRKTLYECVFKRFFDFTLSLLALIVLAPVFFILFISSKICLKGKVIFAQYRPGKNGKVFKLYKFRSMNNKTDENGKLLPDSQRITKFGKFIRKTSLDELPQIFNILKGDMSIVGPRPRMVKDAVFYDRDELQIYSKRPGLTGPAQVSGGRSGSEWNTILQKELSYTEKVTFWGDLKIFFKTFVVLFKSDGASEGSSSAKREYFYCDHLLKHNFITLDQYNYGMLLADDIIANKGKVEYIDTLHK